MYYVIERLISLDKQGNSAKSKCILLLSSFQVAKDESVLCQDRKPKAILENSFTEMTEFLD